MSNVISIFQPSSGIEENEQPQVLSLKDCLDIAEADYQILAQSIVGFKKREGQEQIIRSCVNAIFNNQVLLSQAGTGIGKTFSYLLGCLPYVREQSKHLIVSTHTVALQTQLIEKDLPFVINKLAPELKYEVAKGSGRYFCPKRALDLLSKIEVDTNSIDGKGENAELFALDTAHQNVSDQNMRLVKQIYQDFEQGKLSGDLDTLTYKTPHSVTAMINRDHQRCPGQNRCPKGDSCPFYQQREKIKQADIVITNHALLSQTAIVGATVLGDLTDAIVVLDEAHHFPEVMRDANENKIHQSSVEQLSKQAIQLAKVSAIILKNYPELIHDIDQHGFQIRLAKLLEQADACGEVLQNFGDLVKMNFPQLRGEIRSSFDDASTWILGLDRLHPSMQTQLASLSVHYNQLEKATSDILSKFGTSLDIYSGRLKRHDRRIFAEWQVVASKLNLQCKNAQQCLQRYVEFDQYMDISTRAKAGLARWISVDDDNNDVIIHSNHVNIGTLFQQSLVKKCQAMLLTSATLEAMGSFNFLTSRLGFENTDSDLVTEIVKSPFDYNMVGIKAPLVSGDPNHADHAKVVKHAVLQAANRHKSQLVLFSSYRQMNQTYQLMNSTQQQVVLLQQDHTKSQLISLHKERIDGGKNSILFGVDSLSEGLDLQRQYLTCVLIAKLPFVNMNRPILKSEMQCLQGLGGNPFMDFSLPMCARKLIQSAGRLIRTEDDYGEIYILDPRINTKRYGQKLLHSLPMFHHF
jgi:ATP-dependent DNA helicase DinG